MTDINNKKIAGYILIVLGAILLGLCAEYWMSIFHYVKPEYFISSWQTYAFTFVIAASGISLFAFGYKRIKPAALNFWLTACTVLSLTFLITSFFHYFTPVILFAPL